MLEEMEQKRARELQRIATYGDKVYNQDVSILQKELENKKLQAEKQDMRISQYVEDYHRKVDNRTVKE
jgi:hypothetical protein